MTCCEMHKVHIFALGHSDGNRLLRRLSTVLECTDTNSRPNALKELEALYSTPYVKSGSSVGECTESLLTTHLIVSHFLDSQGIGCDKSKIFGETHRPSTTFLDQSLNVCEDLKGIWMEVKTIDAAIGSFSIELTVNKSDIYSRELTLNVSEMIDQATEESAYKRSSRQNSAFSQGIAHLQQSCAAMALDGVTEDKLCIASRMEQYSEQSDIVRRGYEERHQRDLFSSLGTKPPSLEETTGTASNEKALFAVTREGYKVTMVSTGERWEAIVEEECGCLTRTRRLPIICDGKRNPTDMIRCLFHKPEGCRSRSLHVLEANHVTAGPARLFVGELGIRAGGGDETDEKTSGEDASQSKSESESLPMGEILQVLSAKGITSIKKLADVINETEDTEQRPTLLEFCRRLIAGFSTVDYARVIRIHGEVLREYIHIARIIPVDDTIVKIKRDYIDSLGRKHREGRHVNVNLMAVITTALTTITKSAYPDGTEELEKMMNHMFEQMDPELSPYADTTVKFESDALRMFILVTELLASIDREYWTLGREHGMTERFHKYIDDMLQSKVYYITFQIFQIARKKLFKLESGIQSEVQATNTRIMIAYLKSTAESFEIAHEMLAREFDANGTEALVDAGIESLGPLVPDETWYEWNVLLENACLLSLYDPKFHAKFLTIFQHVKENETKIESFQERKALCCTLMRILEIISLFNKTSEIREETATTLASYINHYRPPKGTWVYDVDVVGVVVRGLAQIAYKGTDPEGKYARGQLQHFGDSFAKPDAGFKAYFEWSIGRTVEGCLDDMTPGPFRSSDDVLFKRVTGTSSAEDEKK